MKKSLLLSNAKVVLLGLALVGLLACGGNSGNEQPDGDVIVDGDGQQTCEINEDCYTPDSNYTCSTATHFCVDHGKCISDDNCSKWYDTALPYCDGGICVAERVDGDQDTTDNDTNASCTDFTGLYDGSFVCGASTETHDANVSVDSGKCGLVIGYTDKVLTGSVNNDTLTTTAGKNCSGTGTQGGPITLTCNDGCTITLTPKTSCTNTGSINIQPVVMDFGSVTAGSNSVKEAMISNFGEGDLVINNIVLAPGSSSAFSVNNASEWTFPLTLAKGESHRLKMMVAPSTNDPQSGVLLVLSNDCTTPILRVSLNSTVKPFPNIIADPLDLVFGSCPPGNGPSYDNRKYFLLRNAGKAPGPITKIELANDGNGNYTLDKIDNQAPSAITYPFTIGATESKAVIVNFHPTATAAQGSQPKGLVRVTWMDVDNKEQTIEVNLIGMVAKLQPPCIDISPLEGRTNMMGSEIPGPGLKFGYASIDGPTTREITIKNCGDEDLILGPWAWGMMPMPDPLQRHFTAGPGTSTGGITLKRGEQVIHKIVFKPVQAGALYTDSFSFTSNATKASWTTGNPNSATGILIGLSGTGARRELAVIPSKVDFGLVTIDCCSRPEEINIFNLGELALKINKVQIGAGSDPLFEITNKSQIDANLPINLGGEGNSQSLLTNVRFCPTSEGDKNGREEVFQDGMTDAAFVVPLRGTGTTLTHQTDKWTQATHPKIDILWTIDCSGSMQEEQDRLAANFDTFINMAVTWHADLHIAVTSCDIVAANMKGKFQGSPTVIKFGGTEADNMTNTVAISTFRDRVNLGTGCDGGQEAGLEASHLALDEPLISNENKGFLREDAKLSIIMVSDEEDQSDSDLSFYINFFRHIKGVRNTSMLEIYSIVGDPDNGCTDNSSGGDAQSAAAGKRYTTVSSACNPHTGEDFMSICKTDYTPVYQTMAENLFALRNQFFLSRLADKNTITVTVNGVVSTIWTYDDVTNSIVFPEGNPPAAGSEIVADYDTLCIKRQ